MTYISSLHVLGFSIRYPDLSKLHSLIGLIPGYGVPPKIKKNRDQCSLIKDCQAFLIFHFEIAGDPCNLISSQQSDLFTNHTITSVLNHVEPSHLALHRIISVSNTK